MAWFLSICAILLVAFVGWATFYALTIDRRLRKQTVGWSETTAEITQASLRTSSGGRGPGVFDITLLYTYIANGVSYHGERSGFFVRAGESRAVPNLPGNTLPLRFQPDDAASNVIFQADVRKLCKSVLTRPR